MKEEWRSNILAPECYRQCPGALKRWMSASRLILPTVKP